MKQRPDTSSGRFVLTLFQGRSTTLHKEVGIVRTLKKPWQIVVGTWKGTPFYTGRLMVHASNRRNLFKPMRDCATAHFMEHHRAVRSSVHRLAIYIGSGWREVGRMHAKRWMVGSRRVRNVEFVTFRAAA